jgi:hypothetical protein
MLCLIFCRMDCFKGLIYNQVSMRWVKQLTGQTAQSFNAKFTRIPSSRLEIKRRCSAMRHAVCSDKCE